MTVPAIRSARRNQRSAEADVYRKLYACARWRRTRDIQLKKQRLCEPCLKRGRITIATVCHHTDPATKLSEATFFSGPFESVCAPCHDGPMQQVERIGYSTEVDGDGFPIDPKHPFNSR